MKAYVIFFLIFIVGLVSIFSNQKMLEKYDILVDTNATILSREEQKEDVLTLNTSTNTTVAAPPRIITNPSNNTSVTNDNNNTGPIRFSAEYNLTNSSNNTNVTNNNNNNNTGPVRFSAEYNLTHFGTCNNTPGRDDLYWIRDAYAISISHTAHLDARQVFITDAHTDLRFENKKRIYGYRREMLVTMFKDFARWCDDHNIKYFLAHGTLLGWHWNERILLWDEDLDIIFDFATFTYLLQFNNTMIEGRYYLELNDNYPYRGYGGMNVIDGMFIDTKTGVYIDITMLTESKFHVNTTDQRFISKTPNCIERNCIEDKSVHRYAYDVIYPLKRITFEGVGSWAPNDVEQHLDQEYTIRGRLSPEFYDEEGVGIEGPVRPQIIKTSSPLWRKSSPKFIRYGFDYELNDWVVTEVSDMKRKEMIDNNQEVPIENKRCLPVREIEYKSDSEPVWLPLWHLCRAKTEEAKKLVAFRFKLRKRAWEINCSACVRPMPTNYTLG